MGHDNVQNAINTRGGVEAMHEADLPHIANEYGGQAAGEAAKNELRNRGLLGERPTRGPLP